MKKLLLGAVAALAVSAPGVASAQSGYVDLGYQSSEGDVSGVDFEGDGWTLGGAAAWGGDGSTGFQLDAGYASGDEDDAWNVGGHLFSRTEAGLMGAFANFGQTDFGTGDQADSWTLGLEAQAYLTRTTLDVGVSYSEVSDLDTTLFMGEAGVTHFVTDNFSIGGGIGFGTVETDQIGSVESDIANFGVGAEWGFGTAPISIYGGWQHTELGDFETEIDTLSVGVRYNWGGNLFERNRSGAGLARSGSLGRFAGLL